MGQRSSTQHTTPKLYKIRCRYGCHVLSGRGQAMLDAIDDKVTVYKSRGWRRWVECLKELRPQVEMLAFLEGDEDGEVDG